MEAAVRQGFEGLSADCSHDGSIIVDSYQGMNRMRFRPMCGPFGTHEGGRFYGGSE